MFAASLLGLIVVFLGYLGRYNKYSFNLAFLLITFFMCIRFLWGNDMPSYYDIFLNSDEYSIASFLEQDGTKLRVELGWLVLCSYFRPLGFLSFQITVAILENYIIYRLIKQYVSPQYYYIALFIYCFNPSFLVLSSSMMRQFLAMSLCIFSIKYIYNRKIIPFLLIVLFAYQFHHSALVFVPAYFLYIKDFILEKKHFFLVLVFLCFWFVFVHYSASSITEYFFTKEAFEDYQNYVLVGGENVLGFGVLLKILFIIYLLFQMNGLSKEDRFFVILVGVELLFIPFLNSSENIARLASYYSIFSIVAIPKIVENTKNKNILFLFFMTYMVLITIFQFFSFFYSPIWYAAYFDYQTIFSHSYGM